MAGALPVLLMAAAAFQCWVSAVAWVRWKGIGEQKVPVEDPVTVLDGLAGPMTAWARPVVCSLGASKICGLGLAVAHRFGGWLVASKIVAGAGGFDGCQHRLFLQSFPAIVVALLGLEVPPLAVQQVVHMVWQSVGHVEVALEVWVGLVCERERMDSANELRSTPAWSSGHTIALRQALGLEPLACWQCHRASAWLGELLQQSTGMGLAKL